MERLIEGRIVRTHYFKHSGMEDTLVNTNEGDGHYAKQADVTGLDCRYVKTGRTIELAPYEFARLDIGINAYFGKGTDVNIIVEAITAVVEELVNREEAVIDGAEREHLEIPTEVMDIVNNQCIGRYITLAYGVTLKGKKRFESNRIDDAWQYQLDDEEDVMGVYEKINDMLGFRIDERRTRLQGTGENLDTGL